MEGRTSVKTRNIVAAAASAGFCAGALAGFLVSRAVADKQLDQKVAEEAEAIRDHYAARTQRDGAGEEDERQPPVGREAEEGSRASDRGGAGLRGGEGGASLGTRWTAGNMGRRGAIPRIETSSLEPGDPGNTGGPFSSNDPDGHDDGTPAGPDPLDGMPDPAPETIPDGWPAEDPRPDGLLYLEDEEPVTGGFTPFLITRTEFYDDTETQNRKLTITFYDGDKVLVDDRDVPIRDNANVVGTDFINHFDGPDDPDIVYVRNNRLRLDFEIVRDERGFSETILNYGKPQ